jgi:hypothetical protein
MSHKEDRWLRLENGEQFILETEMDADVPMDESEKLFSESIEAKNHQPRRSTRKNLGMPPQRFESEKATTAIINDVSEDLIDIPVVDKIVLPVVDKIVYPDCKMKDDDLQNHHGNYLLPSSNFYEPMQESMKLLSTLSDPQGTKAQTVRTRRAENQAHERAWVRTARSRQTRNRMRQAKTFYSSNVIIRKCSAKRITVHVEKEWARKLIKRRKETHSRGEEFPASLSDEILLSDWDGPSLEWARKRDDWPQWLAAIKKEINQLEARGTWKVVQEGEIKKGCRPLGTKLVLKIKRNPDGSVDRYKARLTVQGFLQRYGIDYMDTTSPVTHTSTVKFLKAHALQMERKTKVFDFAGAFLYPTLQDDIYMRAPELLGKGKVILKLLKSIYGLKQASREWFLALQKALLDIGFTQAPEGVDKCLFHHEKLDIYIAAYVDDSFCSYVNEASVEYVIEELKKKQFEFSKIGEFDMGLGLQFETTEDSVFISQPSSVDFIQNEFDVKNIAKPTPITKWQEKRRDDESKFKQCQVTQYLSLLGSLSHLGRMTRPDIILAVFHLASFSADPCERHYDALKHVVQYLLGSKNKGIYFRKTDGCPLWDFYCDSDWAGCPNTRRSTSGYLLKFMGGPLLAVSRRQKNVTLSSCEAEYCTFTDCAKDILWAKGLAKFFKCPFPKPADLRCDNVTAKHMAEGKAKQNRTKHIDALRKHIGVKYHFIRELVDFGELSLTYVDTTQNESDILTKPMARTKFHSAATKLLNESASAYRLNIAQHAILGPMGDNAIRIANMATISLMLRGLLRSDRRKSYE